MLKALILKLLGDDLADTIDAALLAGIRLAEKQGGYFELSAEAKLATAATVVLERPAGQLLVERVGEERASEVVRRVLSLTVQGAQGLAAATNVEFDDALVELLAG